MYTDTVQSVKVILMALVAGIEIDQMKKDVCDGLSESRLLPSSTAAVPAVCSASAAIGGASDLPVAAASTRPLPAPLRGTAAEVAGT